jgi:hypothetical protein
MKTTTFRRLLTFRVPLWALLASFPVMGAARSLWYMDGEDVGGHFDYFLYALSESWPFVLVYIVFAVAISLLSSDLSQTEESDILHP